MGPALAWHNVVDMVSEFIFDSFSGLVRTVA